MSNFYETDRAVAEYLLFHYGSPQQILPYPFGPAGALEFPVRCVTECVDWDQLPQPARALDLGCAVGRASFELARLCPEVVAIDSSQRFIATAQYLQQHGALTFDCLEEGAQTSRATVQVPAGIDSRRVKFETGDAQELRMDMGTFDILLMANVIDRLANPRRCLEKLPHLLVPGGRLIITSPYTWLEEYTPKENWLGGFVRGGVPVRTIDSLREILEPHFNPVLVKDLPFLIREHARKFQWGVAEASLWIRR